MAVTFLTGWEHGVLSNLGGGLISNQGGAPAIETTIVRSGARSLRCAATTASENVILPTISQTIIVLHTALYLVALPSGFADVIWLGGADPYARLALNADGTSTCNFWDGAAQQAVIAGPTFVTGQWYEIWIKWDASGATWTNALTVNKTSYGSQTWAQGAPRTWTSLRVGNNHAVTADAVFDDVVLHDAAADYVAGASSPTLKVVRLAPNADGTHSPSPPAAGRFTDAAVADITAGNPAWDNLDSVPIDQTAEFVEQQTDATAEYVEVTFADLTDVGTLLGVRAVAALFADGTSAFTAKTSVFNGAAETVVFSGDFSDTTLVYKGAIVPTADQTALNALVGRVGYAGSTPSDPRWAALMLEAAYVPAARPWLSDHGYLFRTEHIERAARW